MWPWLNPLLPWQHTLHIRKASAGHDLIRINQTSVGSKSEYARLKSKAYLDLPLYLTQDLSCSADQSIQRDLMEISHSCCWADLTLAASNGAMKNKKTADGVYHLIFCTVW